MYHLHQFLRGRERDMPQETIQVLDVLLRESPSWNYVTVSRSFFSTTFGHRGDIGEGLECWRGYYQSLRPTQLGLSLNIDISATSFFKPVTVIKFVEEFLSIRDTSRPLSDRDRVKIKKALRRVCIETNHQQDQIRRCKITGVTPMPMSQLMFGVSTKVEEHIHRNKYCHYGEAKESAKKPKKASWYYAAVFFSRRPVFSSARRADENMLYRFRRLDGPTKYFRRPRWPMKIVFDCQRKCFIFVDFIPSAYFHRSADENRYFQQLSGYFRRFLADKIALFCCSVISTAFFTNSKVHVWRSWTGCTCCRLHGMFSEFLLSNSGKKYCTTTIEQDPLTHIP
ncbi:hypothetical protein GQ55_9G052300 [Panicum hallii var. hallii]|uniref:Argonaute linker 1 domain-containing protein n=1 Tax=Panicum hallii var. hallii TaxID=1504633 RepID=A0A2T7BZX2_9POAL|nr:hypothetical protein GQ55_9G052300 [Panicum hallii var. hallii]